MDTTTQSAIDQFQELGYCVIETGLDPNALDQAVADMDPYWNGQLPVEISVADESRIQNGWKISESVKAVATCPRVLEILEDLYSARPLPFQTLNFPKGTEQESHSDSIHFNTEPFGMMCGVWVALEDVGMDQGPLVYYPGSHKLPESNYEEVGAPASVENYPRYLDFISSQIESGGF